MFLVLLILMVHISHGSHGFVAWIQPPHIAAGLGIVSGHLVTWLQFR